MPYSLLLVDFELTELNVRHINHYFVLVICRANPETLWREVAERYQQIVQRDIRLLQCQSTSDAFNPFETGQRALSPQGNKIVNNNLCVSRPAILVPRKMNESMNLVTSVNENKDTAGNFPKIVEVFSLNPSVPVRHFQECVTARIAPNGVIVEPSASQSFKPNNDNKQNTKISENSKEKLRNVLSDGYTAHMQDTYDQQKSLYKVYIQTQQCDTAIASHMGMKVGGIMSKSSNPPEDNCFSGIYSGCDYNEIAIQKSSIPNTEDTSTIMQCDSEEVISENNTERKKNKRKRKRICGPRRTKKKIRMDNYAKREQHEEERICNCEVEKQNVQLNYCYSLNDGSIASIDCNIKNNEKESQEDDLEKNNQRKQDDGENLTISIKESREDRIPMVQSDKGDVQSSSSETLFHFQENGVRQNKILELKEKLARQEQELRKLKRKREPIETAREDNNLPDGDEVDKDHTVLIGNKTKFDSSRQTDIITCPQTVETDLDFNPGKLDDLKEIFQKVIKSFKIYQTRLNMTKTGIVIDYGDLPSNEFADKNVFTHVDNRIKLLPKEFPSKEDFLLQLGLIRI